MPRLRLLLISRFCDRRMSVHFMAKILLLLLVAANTYSAETRPRLVLLITVDQLRGDLLWRHTERFSDGGFSYFAENGAIFVAAHYQHATTFTSVGHATIATGGNSAQHGIVGND